MFLIAGGQPNITVKMIKYIRKNYIKNEIRTTEVFFNFFLNLTIDHLNLKNFVRPIYWTRVTNFN